MKTTDVVAAAKKVSVPLGDFIAFQMRWEAVVDDLGDIVSECDPSDSGQTTFAGVDKTNHAWFPFQDPTVDAVLLSYLNDWNAVRASELPNPVGAVVANYAVNCGPSEAVHLLQIAMQRFSNGKGIAVDGHIGPITLGFAKTVDSTTLAHAVVDAGELFYRNLADKHERLRKFLKGWMNRNQDLAAWMEHENPAPVPVPVPTPAPKPKPVRHASTFGLIKAILVLVFDLLKAYQVATAARPLAAPKKAA